MRLLRALLFPPHPMRGCDAPTNAERLYRYRQRLDHAVGLCSEEHLTRVARATGRKAQMIARLRHPIPRIRALVPAGKLRVRKPKSPSASPSRSCTALLPLEPCRDSLTGAAPVTDTAALSQGDAYALGECLTGPEDPILSYADRRGE